MTHHTWKPFPAEKLPGAPAIQTVVDAMLRTLGRAKFVGSIGQPVRMELDGWCFDVDLSTGKVVQYLRPVLRHSYFRLAITTDNYEAVARAYETARLPLVLAPTDPLPWRPQTVFEASGGSLQTLMSSLACRGVAFQLEGADDDPLVAVFERTVKISALTPSVPVQGA